MTTIFFSSLSFVAVFGSGIRDPGSGIRDPRSGIRDPGSEIRDPGSGMGKNQDPGSGINIPDPPHWNPDPKYWLQARLGAKFTNCRIGLVFLFTEMRFLSKLEQKGSKNALVFTWLPIRFKYKKRSGEKEISGRTVNKQIIYVINIILCRINANVIAKCYCFRVKRRFMLLGSQW